MFQPWATKLQVVHDVLDEKPLPLPPGILRHTQPTIAQLAFPSPDDASSPSCSSNASHEPFPASNLTKYDVSPRRPNRLRKPPPSSYPSSFSFVPENPSPVANFPYVFHRSTPTSPAASFVAGPSPARAMSVNSPAKLVRKLTKRRPSDPGPPSAAANLSMARLADIPPVPPLPPLPPLERKNTFNFTLRRKKAGSKSDDGHTSLPALPPPSPLALNIPTFRPFHARRRDSWHVQPVSEPPVELRHSSPPTSELLSQAAWTGVAPEGFAANRGGWKSTWSLSLPPDGEPPPRVRPRPTFTLDVETESPRSESPVASPVSRPRPPLLRRDAVTGSPKRRWTLAMALNDEGISDELLVEKLEALRNRSRMSVNAAEDHETSDWDRVWAAYDDELDSDDVLPPLPVKLPSPASMPSLPSASSTATWQSARRALLTCRELVRTERHYLTSLQALLAGGTRAPPPALMCAYAGALARESAGLLRRMEDDPSAWGVAAAFLGAEEALETALVAWCGVVGGWFVGANAAKGPRRLSKARQMSEGGEELEKEKEPRMSWRTRRGSGASAPRPPPLRISSVGALSAGAPSVESRSAPTTPVPRERERPAVRDLAILPTQRIMRYVLLYRDLLDHTPASSPSRALVERAMEAALRIAQRCDRAQGNAAFLQRR
ncbi:hypothetical protein C8R44DRAFT_883965 [Mycena epipterygia]|nr:hypothetical protein C8R44DRAFT_883965 [Mycena epipterygia]